LVVTRAFHGATPASWTLTVPDFGGASGFNNTWMLRPGISTSYLTEGFSGPSDILFGGDPSAGDYYRFAYRQSQTTTATRIREPDVGRRRAPRPQYFNR
jgi:hypothetical protein